MSAGPDQRRSTAWLRRGWLSALALVLVGALGLACAQPGDQVQLRLFPCEFEGLEPRAVVVEIRGYDVDGALVDSYEVGFDDIAASVFEDGYATVGYRKAPGVVSATFRVGWFSGSAAGAIDEADAIAVYSELEVPALGEVLSLSSEVTDCSDLIAGDGDGDTSGDGDGDTTGDGDGDTTGDGDGDGDTGIELPMPGDPCDILAYPFHCIPELDGQAGTPLYCDPNAMELVETDIFPEIGCEGLCPVGTSNPIDACAGVGSPAKCLCEPAVVESCDGATLGCTGDGHVKLCWGGTVYLAQCPGCQAEGEYFTCAR